MACKQTLIGLAGAAALFLSGCGEYGKVEQGRVISFDKTNGQVTIIRDSLDGRAGKPRYDALPPLAVRLPADPEEMGPEPAAGRLMRVDPANREMVIFDAQTGALQTLRYTLVEERLKVARADGLPVIDRSKKTITVWCEAEKSAITFAATEEMLAMPEDTWRPGDEVRYYYKEPARALRMMNVSKTDMSGS